MSEGSDVFGLVGFPRARQQDRFSCGPVCMRMVCDHLEFHPGVGVKEIGRLSGTNPQTGTTEVEMARGLDALGLCWERPRGNWACGVPYLRQAVAAGNVVMLRTLMPGNRLRPEGFKHWVVVHGGDARRLYITCPGVGAQKWSDEFAHAVWAARDFDHFLVPADRRKHPKALAHERAEWRRAWKPVHEMTLREFIGDVPVVPNHKLLRFHHEMIRAAADAIPLMVANPARAPMAYADAPGFRFHAVPRNGMTADMLVEEAASGRVAGGIARGLRWAHPAFRGRGLGAEIALAAHSEPDRRFLRPSSYSEAGYQSRVAAHRLAVQRALAAGLAVPAHVTASLLDADAPATPNEQGVARGDDRQLRLF